MSAPHRPPHLRSALGGILLLLTALGLSACDSSTDLDDEEVAASGIVGTWSGTARLGTQGRATTLNLQQSGSTVSGTITMTAILPQSGVALSGEVTPSGVLTFAAAYPEECRVLTGQLVRTGNSLSGSVALNRQNCNTESGLSGPLTAERN